MNLFLKKLKLLHKDSESKESAQEQAPRKTGSPHNSANFPLSGS
jgi:hypothetical protein